MGGSFSQKKCSWIILPYQMHNLAWKIYTYSVKTLVNSRKLLETKSFWRKCYCAELLQGTEMILCFGINWHLDSRSRRVKYVSLRRKSSTSCITTNLATDFWYIEFCVLPEIYQKLKDGVRPYFRPTMEAADCPNYELASVIRRCWSEDPAERPDFQSLKSIIRKLNK